MLSRRESFAVHTYEVDAFGTLAVPALSGYLSEVAGLHAGEWCVTAVPPSGYFCDTATNSQNYPAGKTDADLVLKPYGVVAGRVVEAETGTPIAPLSSGREAESSGQCRYFT
jgi:hypothetical protein